MDLGNRGISLIYVGKTKVQISCGVIAQLICAFVLAYAKCRFSHDAAHLKHEIASGEANGPN